MGDIRQDGHQVVAGKQAGIHQERRLGEGEQPASDALRGACGEAQQPLEVLGIGLGRIRGQHHGTIRPARRGLPPQGLKEQMLQAYPQAREVAQQLVLSPARSSRLDRQSQEGSCLCGVRQLFLEVASAQHLRRRVHQRSDSAMTHHRGCGRVGDVSLGIVGTAFFIEAPETLRPGLLQQSIELGAHGQGWRVRKAPVDTIADLCLRQALRAGERAKR